jgi:lactoylglutathione lyase
VSEMQLGAFSISLAVQDLAASKAFYEAFGFSETGGDADAGWLILKNGPAIIGLFHGMFDGNIITLNPGLNQDTSQADEFTDVRDVQAALDAAGIELSERTEPDGTGPAHIVAVDPDGNTVMIDQFFDRPG